MHLPPCGFDAYSRFLYAIGFLHPITCIWDRLLGPCFKTGRIKSPWQNLHTESSTSISVSVGSSSCPGHLPTLFQIPKFILPLACGKYIIVRYRTHNKPVRYLTTGRPANTCKDRIQMIALHQLPTQRFQVF